MRLRVFKEVDVRLPRQKLQRLFDTVTSRERGGLGEINVVFTGDKRMQELNHRFRHKDRATDVLSFNLDDRAEKNATFGEIYISVATASRQAKEYGVSLEDELLRLTCHGLLHLFGYDHHRRDDAAEMRMREERYLAAAKRK